MTLEELSNAYMSQLRIGQCIVTGMQINDAEKDQKDIDWPMPTEKGFLVKKLSGDGKKVVTFELTRA